MAARFRIGQRVRVAKKCGYYPSVSTIPSDVAVNRYAFVRVILGGGSAYGVSIPGYENVVDYRSNELLNSIK